MDLKGQVFLCSSPKSGFDNPAEADVLKGSTSQRVINATQRDQGVIVIYPEIVSKAAFLDGRLKPSLFAPSGHCPRFLHPKDCLGRQQGGTVVGGYECIEVLQDDLHLIGPGIGQQTQRPEVRLPQVAEADDPEPRGKDTERWSIGRLFNQEIPSSGRQRERPIALRPA